MSFHIFQQNLSPAEMYPSRPELLNIGVLSAMSSRLQVGSVDAVHGFICMARAVRVMLHQTACNRRVTVRESLEADFRQVVLYRTMDRCCVKEDEIKLKTEVLSVTVTRYPEQKHRERARHANTIGRSTDLFT